MSGSPRSTATSPPCATSRSSSVSCPRTRTRRPRPVRAGGGSRAIMSAASDARFMAMALALAERGLGNVWPNPAVGCVLVKDGRVVGRGWTQPGGRPHAESEAIDRAGAAARGSTAYVTLEPCAHHGRTPPCVDLMLGAGIARAVVAAVDPGSARRRQGHRAAARRPGWRSRSAAWRPRPVGSTAAFSDGCGRVGRSWR